MTDDTSAEQQAMMLFEVFQQVMGGEEEEDEEDERVQCPICNKYHEPTEQHDAANKAEACSHGCLVVYIAHHCPICLEDPAGPPMVAMPCGHLVCTADFKELGGYLGEKPKDEDRPSLRRARERREERRMDPNHFMQQLNLMRMMGIPPFGFGMPPGFTGFDSDDDEDDDDEDYDDEDDSDEDDSEEDDSDDDDDDSEGSCPPLERVGGSGDDSDAGSVPPLEPVRRDNGGDDSDDDSMPPLIARNDNGSGDDDDDSMPPLLPRDCSDDDSDDDESLPPLITRRSHSSSDDDDDDASLPPLLAGNGDLSSDEEGSAGSVDGDSDDDDNSMPALSHMDGRLVQDDDDSLPPMAKCITSRKDDSSDNESEEEVEEEEEEVKLPYPALKHIGDASCAHTVLTIGEYWELPEAQRDVALGGAWLLLPSEENEDFSTLLYTTLDKSIHMGVFGRESRLVVNDEQGVLVCEPKKADANKSVIWDVNLERTERVCEIPTNAQVTSNGEGGVWTLTSSGGTKELSFYDVDNPTGSIMDVLPESSYIIQDPLGAVWIHVRKKGSMEMEPGLYYFLGRGQITIINSIQQDAKCSPGTEGVCVATNVHGQVELSNVGIGPVPAPVMLPFAGSSKDIRIIPREIDDGMYVHCRKDNCWKLCLLEESGQFKDICYCPEDARVVGDGQGGAWILKRTGASHQSRMLVSVSNIGVVRDHGLAFPPGSKICGL